MDENSVGAVHRHNLDAGGIHLQIHLREDILDGVNERTDRRGFDSSAKKDIIIL
jgi:hypothetical protein